MCNARFQAHRLQPEDFARFDRQSSQAMQLGMSADMSAEEMAAMASQREAWCCTQDGRTIGAIGIVETFPGTQGVAWALLGPIGDAHLPLTRFARARIAASPLKRIEAIALCGDAEAVLARYPDLDPWALLMALLATPTPEMKWAMLVGLKPVAVLRQFGAAAETHMLFEAIKP